jgi:hypothetical protein
MNVSLSWNLEFSSRGWFANLSHEFRQTRRFEGVRFFPNSRTVSPDNNVAADVLSKLGSKRALVPADVYVQDIRKQSIRLLSDPETS